MRFKDERGQMEWNDDTVFSQHEAKSREMSCHKFGVVTEKTLADLVSVDHETEHFHITAQILNMSLNDNVYCERVRSTDCFSPFKLIVFPASKMYINEEKSSNIKKSNCPKNVKVL